jgi:prepilin-type N-terminal cleavage/methylation domain-containing protein
VKNKQNGFSLIELLIVVAIILIIAAIAIPNLLRSKMAANEASAVGSMRTINTSSVAFSTTYGNYPTLLTDLGPATTPTSAAADLIDSALVTGIKSGYHFDYTATSPYTTYVLTGDPVSTSTGQRHFYTDQSGVIRADTATIATSASTPIS